MPQRQQIRWSQLRVGLLTLASLTLLAIGIFLITGQTGLFTKTLTLRTFSPDAGGLKNGAPVRLTGVDVGTVKNVQVSGLPDPSQAVEIDMQVNQKYQGGLRQDSEAFLTAEGLLGERYINISRGSPNAPPVSDGATIPFHSTAEFSELVGGSRDLIDNLNQLATRLNLVIGRVESGEGTVGKLLMDDTLYRRLDKTATAVQDLVGEITSGKGSLGRLLASDEMYQNLTVTVNKLQSAIDVVEHGQGTVAKLLNDPTLYNNADRLIQRGTVLVDNVNQGRGTLGKLAQDDELYRRLNSTVDDLNAIVAGLRNGEGSMGRLLHDPTLYENLNSTSVGVRELMADFRHNPKKFLTIHFRVF